MAIATHWRQCASDIEQLLLRQADDRTAKKGTKGNAVRGVCKCARQRKQILGRLPPEQVLPSLRCKLRRRARWITPALLLAEAVERLHIRPIRLPARGLRSDRALANVEAFIAHARLYAESGIKRFVRDMTREWRLRESRTEGRVDGDGDAIEIITIHSAKGLEWPVVIPIKTATWLRGRPDFVHRLSDNTIHWIVGDVVPPGLRSALATDEESQARERQRLWYVARARARDLLIVPLD